jgi:hypothetical protein
MEVANNLECKRQMRWLDKCPGISYTAAHEELLYDITIQALTL